MRDYAYMYTMQGKKEENSIELIDGQYICHKCLSNNHDPLKVYLIGFVDN
ncbi:MAG: hypothetical protein R6U96_17960 [Promethearchaeia archaeon]